MPPPTEIGSITPTQSPPLQTSFDFAKNSKTIHLGECVDLIWNVDPTYVSKITINNQSVNSPPDHVCPKETTTYTLVVKLNNGREITEFAKIVVLPPDTATPTPKPTATPLPSPTGSPQREVKHLSLINESDPTNNWENQTAVFPVRSGSFGFVTYLWSLLLVDPNHALQADCPTPCIVKYQQDFARIQKYTADLGWVNNLAIPQDLEHGYGVLFTTQDGTEWLLRLAIDPKSEQIVYSLARPQDKKAKWQACNCSDNNSLYFNNKIEVSFKDDGSTQITVNGKLLPSTIPPAQGDSPQNVGLVIFGKPAHALIYSAVVDFIQ